VDCTGRKIVPGMRVKHTQDDTSLGGRTVEVVRIVGRCALVNYRATATSTSTGRPVVDIPATYLGCLLRIVDEH
jgi:hypothetical protein